ncbi:Phosphate metabolism transcription protein [Ascosphaera acerosa]|nr:Phosphate metabolism transcription protein [Ascosphaera acerosa]
MTFPFAEIRPGEIDRFPHALLEIRIRDDARKGSKEWLADLMRSHLVRESPRFSKFVHGVAELFEDHVNSFPFWLSDLDTDIRRDPDDATSERDRKRHEDHFAAGSFVGSLHTAHRLPGPEHTAFREAVHKGPARRSITLQPGDVEQLRRRGLQMQQQRRGSCLECASDQVIVEEGESAGALAGSGSGSGSGSAAGATTTPVAGTAATPHPAAAATTALRDDIASAGSSPRIGLGLRRYVFDRLPLRFRPGHRRRRRRRRSSDVQLPPGVEAPRAWLKDAGPLRVEAKVWLANQRTFIKWQHIAVLLASLSAALYNAAATRGDRLAAACAVAYTAFAVFAGAWGYGVYVWRSGLIRKRSGKDFDNVAGPLVVCVGLMAALILNFWLKWSEFQQRRSAPHPPAAGPASPLPDRPLWAWNVSASPATGLQSQQQLLHDQAAAL